MQAIGDQGGRADLTPDRDAVARNQLVAEEADDPGGGHPPEVVDRLRVGEPAYGLVGGHDCRGRSSTKAAMEIRQLPGHAACETSADISP